MTIINYISSFSIFLISIYIYRNRKSIYNIITSIMLFTLGLAPFSWILFQEDTIFTNELSIWILFFPFLLLFSVIYPYEIDLTKSFKSLKYKYFIFAPYFLYFFIYFLIKILEIIFLKESMLINILKYATDFIISKLFSFVLIILNLIYIFFSYYLLNKKIELSESESLKKQLNLFLQGLKIFIFVFIISILTQYFGILNKLITPERIKLLYSIAIIINAVLIGLSMAKYKFLKIRLKRKSSFYYIVWSFFILLFTSIISLILYKFASNNNRLYFLITTTLGFVLFIFYIRQVKKFISYFFVKDKMNYEEIIKNFFLKLVKNNSFIEIRNMVIEELKNLLNIEDVDLILVDNKDDYKNKSYYNYFEMSDNYKALYDWAIYFFPLKFQNKMYGFLLIGNKITNSKFNKNEIDILKSISLQISMILHKMDVDKELYEKKLMEKELNLAKKIQFSLLPSKNINDDDIKIFWRYKPATKIGGDYCDVIKTDDNNMYFIIADVSGKGMDGAIYMSMIRTLFHTTLQKIEIEKILIYLNDYLKNKLPAKIFVTMAIFIYKRDLNKLEYIHLGHNRPYKFSANKNNIEKLPSSGLALGLVNKDNFVKKLKIKEIEFNKNDFVFTYTDGITEARNNKNKLYSDERLLKNLNKYKNTDVENIVNNISQDIFNFRGDYKQSDDIAMLTFRKK